MTTISIRVAATILDEIENVYDDITKRAYEKFLDRGGTCTVDIEDWLAAERELLLKPAVQLIERKNYFIVQMGPLRPEPSHVNIVATEDDLLVQSTENYPQPRIFRTVHFPQTIDLGLVAWSRRTKRRASSLPRSNAGVVMRSRGVDGCVSVKAEASSSWILPSTRPLSGRDARYWH